MLDLCELKSGYEAAAIRPSEKTDRNQPLDLKPETVSMNKSFTS
jgi:hypothetical protein